MSTLEADIQEQETERAERPVLRREFAAELSTRSDGRTIDALIVPYNVPTEVADPPDYRRYTEMFVKGAFARALKAPFRVWLNFEHKPGFQNVIGNGVTFEERDDGLYGELEIDEGQDGDKALRFVHKNILRSLSVEFKAMSRDLPNADGVVVRRSVHLDAVALCRRGAYDDAKVLAVREEPHLIVEEALRPVDIPTEAIDRCRRLGIALPQRYQAHPADPDTPAEAGTSEDGTRQITGNEPSSEE